MVNEVNFLGVVVGRGWQDTQFLKERQGWMMARVARLMGAQIAIVSADMSGTGGNNTIDFMQTIKACEHMGLQTVAILQESGNPDGSDPTLVDYVPEADALVSVGGVGWHAPAGTSSGSCHRWSNGAAQHCPGSARRLRSLTGRILVRCDLETLRAGAVGGGRLRQSSVLHHRR